MDNYTRAEIVEQIDFERRESNSKFISPTQTIKLLGRATKRIIREPGIRTIPDYQDITVTTGVAEYALDSSFKEVISLWSGEGAANGVKFTYKAIDDFESSVDGYHYTFTKPGYITIKVPEVNNIPSSTLKLRFWSKDIILDADGVTRKKTWGNDEDKSGLDSEFDDFYVEYCTAIILRRENKAEWKDRMATANEILGSFKEQPGNKTRDIGGSFGFYKGVMQR